MPRVVPSFFIIGGPRCGTSALRSFLTEHPNVFLPGPLEPHYFCPDLQVEYRVTTLEDYRDLFAAARECHTAVGENAGWYLHSDIAVSEILKFNPDARIVALVRNPIELVKSLHAYNLTRSIEDEPDLQAAWSLQDARQQGQRLPGGLREPRQLQYLWIGRLGIHLERAMAIVPRRQLEVFVLDDLKANPQQVYERLLAFLSLPSDHRGAFPLVNVSKRSRSAILQHLLYRPPATLRLAGRALAGVVGTRRVHRAIGRLRRLNRTVSPPSPISPQFRSQLAEAFAEDVALLSRLLGRDLTDWLST